MSTHAVLYMRSRPAAPGCKTPAFESALQLPHLMLSRCAPGSAVLPAWTPARFLNRGRGTPPMAPCSSQDQTWPACPHLMRSSCCNTSAQDPCALSASPLTNWRKLMPPIASLAHPATLRHGAAVRCGGVERDLAAESEMGSRASNLHLREQFTSQRAALHCPAVHCSAL